MIAGADPSTQHALLMLVDQCMDTLYYVNLDGYLDSADTPQRKGVAITMLIAPKMTYGVPDGTGNIHYENFGRLSTHAIDVVLSWLDRPCPAIDMTVFMDPEKDQLLPSQLCPRTRNIVGRLLWMYCGGPILNGRSDWARSTDDNDDVSPFPVDAFRSWYRENRTNLVFDWKEKSFGRDD